MKRSAVFFDFDGTLTRADSFLPFLRSVVGWRTYWLKLAFCSPVILAYLVKLLPNDVAKQIVLRIFLRGMALIDLQSIGKLYAEQKLEGLLRPLAMERLQWHREQGHVCVLVSASLDVYLQHWAEQHGIDGLICSSLATDQAGKVTGRLLGANCFGVEKVRRIESWLVQHNCQADYGYGDSKGDWPMLSFCREGYLVKKSRFVPVVTCYDSVVNKFYKRYFV